jgi:hypothetical protein
VLGSGIAVAPETTGAPEKLQSIAQDPGAPLSTQAVSAGFERITP